LLGLAYLTRPEGIGYILVCLGWIVADGVLKKKWFKKLAFMGVLISSAFIFVVPYVIYIHQETGQWLISKKFAGIQSQLLRRGGGEADSPQVMEQVKPEKNNSRIIMIIKNMIKNMIVPSCV
jgi:hypothetical protein